MPYIGVTGTWEVSASLVLSYAGDWMFTGLLRFPTGTAGETAAGTFIVQFPTDGFLFIIDGADEPVEEAGLPAGFEPAVDYILTAPCLNPNPTGADTYAVSIPALALTFNPPTSPVGIGGYIPVDFPQTGLTRVQLVGLVGANVNGTCTAVCAGSTTAMGITVPIKLHGTYVAFGYWWKLPDTTPCGDKNVSHLVLAGSQPPTPDGAFGAFEPLDPDNLDAAPTPTITSIEPNHGQAGEGLVIQGVGFGDGATVSFDGTDALEVAVLSQYKITCAPPVHALGDVDVVVTNPDTVASAPATFTYTAHVVAITKVTPSRGPTSGGTPLQINGRGFLGLVTPGNPTVTIGGIGAPVTDAAGDAYVHVTAPTHVTGEADVTVTNADGEAATLAAGYTYANTGPPPMDLVFRTPSGDVSRLARTDNPAPKIVQALGQPASATFSTPVEPSGLDPVVWTCLGQVLFEGVIVKALARTDGRDKIGVWDADCLDDAHLLAKGFPVGEWTAISATTVLHDLMATAPGFSATIEPALTQITAQLDGSKDLWSTIVEVCQLAGAKCFLASRTLHVFRVDSGYDPPTAVTDDNPDLLWPESGQAVTLQLDYTQLANSVTVRGAEGVSALVEDGASIAKFGRCPLPIFDNTLTTVDECQRRAQVVVDGQAWPVPVVTYATRDLKTMAGKTVAIHVSKPAINASFLIQNVDIDELALLATGQKPRFAVTAVPPWAPALQRADPTTTILQAAIDGAAAVNKQPRLDGAVSSDPGGSTTLAPVPATALAGCIGSDKLTPTPVDPGSYGDGAHLAGFTVDQAGRITGAAEDPVPVAKTDGSQPYTANQSMGGNKLVAVGMPTVGTDAANKDYVDAIASGMIFKGPARVATTGNLAALSGLLTVDGVTLVAGDRVLVKNQTAGATNGIYTAAAAAWPRASDANSSGEVKSGLFLFVDEGTTQADTSWVLSTNDPINLGSTPLVFIQFGAGGGGGGTGDIRSDGTVPFAADESMGGHKLTNVANPVGAQDAATRAYADAVAATARAYTDTGDALAIKKDGSVAFTGDQSHGGHKITNVTDPTAAQDAATKAYVDAAAAAITSGSDISATVYSTGGQVFAHGVEQALTLAVAAFDTDGMWSASTPTRLTINHAGKYLARAMVTFGPGVAGALHLRIYNSGTLVAEQTVVAADLASGNEAHEVAWLGNLAGGAYLEVKVLAELAAGSGSVANVAGVNATFVQAIRITSGGGSSGGGGTATPGALVLLASLTAANVAALDFLTRTAPGQSGAIFAVDFETYIFELFNVIPVTATGVIFYLDVSTDGGATWQTTNYRWALHYFGDDGLASGVIAQGSSGALGAVGVELAGLVASTASEGVVGRVQAFLPTSTVNVKSFLSETWFRHTNTNRYRMHGGGTWTTAGTAVNALRFRFDAGNIASGTIRCYGVAK